MLPSVVYKCFGPGTELLSASSVFQGGGGCSPSFVVPDGTQRVFPGVGSLLNEPSGWRHSRCARTFAPCLSITFATPQRASFCFGALICWLVFFVEHCDDGVPCQCVLPVLAFSVHAGSIEVVAIQSICNRIVFDLSIWIRFVSNLFEHCFFLVFPCLSIQGCKRGSSQFLKHDFKLGQCPQLQLP